MNFKICFFNQKSLKNIVGIFVFALLSIVVSLFKNVYAQTEVYSNYVLVTANYTASGGIGNYDAKITSVTYCGEQLSPLAERIQNTFNGAPGSVIELWGKSNPKSGNCEVVVRFDKDPGQRILSSTVFSNINVLNPIKEMNVFKNSTVANTNPSQISTSMAGSKNSMMVCTYGSYPEGGKNLITPVEPRFEFFRHDGKVDGEYENINSALAVTPTRTVDGETSQIVWNSTETMPWIALCANFQVKPPVTPPTVGLPVPTAAPTVTPRPTPTFTPTPTPTASPSTSVDLKINESDGPVSVVSGNTTTLYWSSIPGVNGCVASGGWKGNKSANGSEVVGPITKNTTYKISCKNQNGSTVADSITVNVSKSSQKLYPPTGGFSPANNATQTTKKPELSWNAVLPTSKILRPEKYQIQIATDTGFNNIVDSYVLGAPSNPQKGDTSSYTPNTELSYGATYYWRVRSLSSFEGSSWSSRRTLKIGYGQLQGVNWGVNIDSLRPTFSWEKMADNVSYVVQYSTDDGKSWKTLSGSVTKEQEGTSGVIMVYWEATADLPRSTTIKTRVYAKGSYGNGAVSENPRSIYVPNPPLPVTSAKNVAPENYNGRNTPYQTWIAPVAKTTPAADFYQIEAASDKNFANRVYFEDKYELSKLLVDIQVIKGRIYFYGLQKLDSGATYYWRVRAAGKDSKTGGTVYGNWTTGPSFKTNIDTPTLVSPKTDEKAISLRPDFQWKSVNGASSYLVQYSTDEGKSWKNMSGKVTDETNGIVTFSLTKDLLRDTSLWWRVVARSGTYGNSTSGSPTLLTANPPLVPNSKYFSPSQFRNVTTQVLNWRVILASKTIPTAARYDIQVATDSKFTNIVQEKSNIYQPSNPNSKTNVSYTISPSLAKGIYYWRVRAISSSGHISDWSNAKYLRVR